MEGASGGGHRASGVTAPRLPVGNANFVRAHPWVGAAVMAKPKDAGAGVIEREDFSCASNHRIGHTRSVIVPCLQEVDAVAPH